MSKSIDERVVRMELENESFERKAAQSTKTVKELDKALELKNGKRSFEDVEAAAEKTNFSSLIKAADTVTSKLSNLGVVGVTALTNLTNKAVDAGEKLVKSLTIDQVMAGWNKMDQITKSTGTLVSQGYDLSNVESQLDKLNWFTDETSYNLSSMVENIAKFTATGQNLDESAVAMEGIALWAALSGQNASTAERAMYQLSQALGAGYMRLEDYRSIQNASMDTDEFRQKALDAAVALGTLQDNLDGTYTSLVNGGDAFTKSQFAQSLTEGAWFTSDVMMEVYRNYASAVDQIYNYAKEKGITTSQAIEELGDKVDGFGLKAFRAGQEARSFGDAIDSVKDAASTGWMKTFKIIFGNYDQQRVLWTDLANSLYDIFVEPINQRNQILSEAFSGEGRDLFFDGIKNSLGGLLDRMYAISDAWKKVFPPISGTQIRYYLEAFNNLSKTFRLNEQNAKRLDNIFTGLFHTIKFMAGTSLEFIKAFTPLTKLVSYFGTSTLQVFGKIGSGLNNMFSGNGYRGAFSSISNIIDAASDSVIAISEVVYRFGNYVSKFIPKIDLLTPIANAFGFAGFNIENALNNAANALRNFNNYLNNITDEDFDSLFTKISSLAESATNKLEYLKNKLQVWGKSVKQFISPVIRAFQKLKTKLDPYINKSLETFSKFGNYLSSYVVDPIKGFVKELIDSDEPLETFLNSFGRFRPFITNAARGFKELLDNVDFSKWKKTASEAFETVKDSISKFVSFIGESLDKLTFKDLLAGAAGVTTLAAIQKVSDAFAKVGSLADTVKATFSSINNVFKAKQLSGFVGNFKAIAEAIFIVAASLTMLTMVDTDKLRNAVAIIGILSLVISGIVVGLNAATKLVTEDKVKVLDSMSGVLIKLAAAIGVMSLALLVIKKADFSSYGEMLRAVDAIGWMGLILAGTTFLLSKITTKLAVGTIAVLGVAVAIYVLVAAIKKLADLKLGATTENILELTTVLVLLVTLTALAGKIKLTNTLGIVGAVGSLLLIIALIETFKRFSLNGLESKIGEIIVVVGAFVGLIVLLATVSSVIKNEAKDMAALGIGVLAVMGVIFILIKLTQALSQVDTDIRTAADVVVNLGILVAFLITALGLASKLSGGAKNFLAVSVAAAAAVIAIGMLVLLVKTLQGITWAEVEQSVTIIRALTTLISALMIAIGFASYLGKGAGLIYIVGALGILLTVAGIMMTLSNFTWGQMWPVMTAVTGVLVGLSALFVAFGLAIKAASTNKRNFGTLIGITVMLAALGAALYIVSLNNWKSILAGIAAMTVVLIAVAVVLKLLSGVVVNAGTIISAVAIIAALGGLMISLTFAMSLIQNYNVEDFKSKVTTLGIALGILAVAIVGLGALFGYVPIIAAGAIAFAAVMVIMNLGILIFSAAMAILDGCDIAKIADDLLPLAGALALTGLAGLAMAIGAPGILLGSVALLAFGVACLAAAGGLAVFNAALTNFLYTLSAIGSALGIDALANLKAELDSISQASVEVSQETGSQIPTAQADGIKSGTTEVTGAVDEMGSQTVDSINQNGEEAANIAEEQSTAIVEAAAKPFEEAEIGGGFFDKLFGDDALNLDSLTANISEKLTGAFGNIDMSKIAGLFSGDFATKLGEGIDLSSFSSILGGKFSELDLSQSMTLNTESITSGMNNQLTTAAEATDTKIASDTVANKYSQGVATSMVSGTNLYSVRQSGVTLTNEANDGGQSVDTTVTGAYIVQGIVQGINDNAWLAYSAAEELAQQCSNIINSSLKINSPSKVTYKSGSGIVEGLALGIDENAPLAYSSVESLANRTIKTFSAALDGANDLAPARITPVLDMSEIYDAMSDFGVNDEEWNPVIRPILDMSRVNSGLKNLRAIVANKAEMTNRAENQNGSTVNNASNSMVFNQYNYSPKALNRVEIYRQTNNQFAAMKGLVRSKV